MSRPAALVLLVAGAASLTSGCAVVADPFAQSLSAEGISGVDAMLERGDYSYSGRGATMFDISGRSYASATQQENAAAKEAGNTWSVRTQDGLLWMTASTTHDLAGVDFDVTGPAGMAMAVETGSGTVALAGVEGSLGVVATRIELDDVVGEGWFVSEGGGIRGSVQPWDGAGMVFETHDGEVVLDLPWGLAYDLQVWGDPEHAVVVDDLGFQHTASDGAYFAASSGTASVEIEVYATGGPVTIRAR